MSCDIHAHFEIKVDGEWIHYSQPAIGQNYRLFAKMAGVRNTNEIDPISLPRGLPDDISLTTLLDVKYWKVSGHSHSWLNAEEIAEVIQFHEQIVREMGGDVVFIHIEQWGYLYGNGWGSFLKYLQYYPDWVEDIRLLFWFDC